ncbi:MAG: DUF1925 domain-containing protein [Planctomycetia bacterium]|nr:DUF1925 domain-containing protein [Planctomycetia bacterium]
MSAAVRFVFVLHDHQPVGNFDEVIEQAYHASYLPFLDLFERHRGIRLALHTSGPLVEWLDRRHPDYLDRLAGLAAAGRVEIVGGAFQEPVLAMLPARDRIGQITAFTQWLQQRLGAKVSGMWVAERVWDPGMTADIVAAGIEWTILDDSHFKAAGLGEDELDRLWITEGDGATLAVFPVSERLRYVIPFAAPHTTIDHLRWLGERRHGALAVFGDDGEKFGVWPDTHRACFEEGWLEAFFSLLERNADWIEMALPSEVVRDTLPAGPIWLPECSYREMTEWVLPPERQRACVAARVAAAADPTLANAAQFLRGGTWRNFRMRYPEANEMYARMLAVSGRLELLRRTGTADPATLADATRALYRGQCNCGYWHGAFGGIYLPHLRNAIYRELIAADKAADRAEGRRGEWIEATAADHDFDGRTDIRLSSDRLDAWIAPAKGGMLYELDLRDQEHNLLATLDRRPEAYHEQVLAGPAAARSAVDAAQPARFKQEGLDRMVRHDRSRRKSLVDHFWDCDVAAPAVAEGTALYVSNCVFCHGVPGVVRQPARIARPLDAHHRTTRASTPGVAAGGGCAVAEFRRVRGGNTRFRGRCKRDAVRPLGTTDRQGGERDERPHTCLGPVAVHAAWVPSHRARGRRSRTVRAGAVPALAAPAAAGEAGDRVHARAHGHAVAGGAGVGACARERGGARDRAVDRLHRAGEHVRAIGQSVAPCGGVPVRAAAWARLRIGSC